MYDAARMRAVEEVSAKVGLTPEAFIQATVDAALNVLAREKPEDFRCILSEVA